MKPPERPPASLAGRAFELDFLRGFALFMMLLHHLAYDLRYLFGVDAFAFQESGWFLYALRPVFVSVFLAVSGICSTFSRSNARRGGRMLLAALLLSLLSWGADLLFEGGLLIVFNILHLLALATILYAGLERLEGGRGHRTDMGDAVLVLLSLAFVFAWRPLAEATAPASWALLPFGLVPAGLVMSDYMPLVPWLGFFLGGVLIGRIAYAGRTTRFPGAEAGRTLPYRLSRPFRFLGRHSLWVYALHQPILIGLLSLVRLAGWI